MACMCNSKLSDGLLEILAIEGYLSVCADAELHSQYLDRLVGCDTEMFRCWYCLNFGGCSSQTEADFQKRFSQKGTG